MKLKHHLYFLTRWVFRYPWRDVTTSKSAVTRGSSVQFFVFVLVVVNVYVDVAQPVTQIYEDVEKEVVV